MILLMIPGFFIMTIGTMLVGPIWGADAGGACLFGGFMIMLMGCVD